MGDVRSEPTMEEILSSIKRVIEESETPVARPRRPVARTGDPQDASADSSPRDPFSPEEILELSDRAPSPAAEPRPVDAVETPTPPPRPESILSADAVEASRGPLEALSRMIVKPGVAGSDTLEGLVREMLRPMLRDWLDAHLPGVVETMVAREIARISGRGL